MATHNEEYRVRYLMVLERKSLRNPLGEWDEIDRYRGQYDFRIQESDGVKAFNNLKIEFINLRFRLAQGAYSFLIRIAREVGIKIPKSERIEKD